jgi:hypothetical protein
MRFPLHRRCLYPLQLLEHLQQAGSAFDPGGGRGVLPTEQKPNEVADGHRVNQPPATLAAGPVQADE